MSNWWPTYREQWRTTFRELRTELDVKEFGLAMRAWGLLALYIATFYAIHTYGG